MDVGMIECRIHTLQRDAQGRFGLILVLVLPPCSWDSGETYLITDRCLTSFLAKMAQGLDVRTRCPVERIEYGGPEWGVRLHCSGGRKIRCKRVIVTASLRILQVSSTWAA